jgi:hypothetical protein
VDACVVDASVVLAVVVVEDVAPPAPPSPPAVLAEVEVDFPLLELPPSPDSSRSSP